MSDQRVQVPHHVYDEVTNLESFSVEISMNSIIAQVVYVEDVTPIPQQGQIVEFHVLGTSVQAIVTHSSLMSVREGVELHIQATRLQE